MSDFWDSGRLTGLELAASDWSSFLVLNATPAAGSRTEDDGARMAGGLAFDADGTLVTAMYRHLCIPSAFSRFSTLLVKVADDLSSQVATDIYTYQAGSAGSGYDPKLRFYASAAEWAPTCGFDILGSSYMFVSATGNDGATTTNFSRKAYSTNAGGAWTSNYLSSDSSGNYHNPFSAAVGADWSFYGRIRANTMATEPTTNFGNSGAFDAGVTDSTASTIFALTSDLGVYRDGNTVYDYTRVWERFTKTRANRVINLGAFAINPGEGLKWRLGTSFRPTVSSYTTGALNVTTFIAAGNGDANGFDAGYIGDPNPCIAYWQNPLGADEVDDIILYAFLDQNGTIRIGRRTPDTHGAPGNSDLDGASNLDPESPSRTALLVGTTMGTNGMEMCHDKSTKSRVFLVTQVLDGAMQMFYTDDGGVSWEGPNTIPGSADTFNFANGAADNRSRFFVASFTPSDLYVMALTNTHADAAGKTEWAVTKWTDPAG